MIFDQMLVKLKNKQIKIRQRFSFRQYWFAEHCSFLIDVFGIKILSLIMTVSDVIFNSLPINATYNNKMRKGFVLALALLLLIATTNAIHIFVVDDIRMKAVPEDDQGHQQEGGHEGHNKGRQHHDAPSMAPENHEHGRGSEGHGAHRPSGLHGASSMMAMMGAQHEHGGHPRHSMGAMSSMAMTPEHEHGGRPRHSMSAMDSMAMVPEHAMHRGRTMHTMSPMMMMGSQRHEHGRPRHSMMNTMDSMAVMGSRRPEHEMHPEHSARHHQNM